jgi:molecular chaperone DnaK
VSFKRPQEDVDGGRAGLAARSLVGNSQYATYHNFKMLLGEKEDVIKRHWRADVRHTPEEVTKFFFGYLAQELSERGHNRVEKVIVTTPNIWSTPNKIGKRDILVKSIKRELRAGVVKFSYEPDAAAHYYLYEYHKKYQKYFTGHLLICDCGGGTMDFSLVRTWVETDKPQVEHVATTGTGDVLESLGKAGVAFDEAVIGAILPDLKGSDPIRWNKRLNEFESSKISQMKTLTDYLGAYCEDPSNDIEITEIEVEGNGPVKASELCSAFDTVVKPELVKALEGIKCKFSEKNVRIGDSNSFRVVLVGGFSQFFLVQKAIYDLLGGSMEGDLRFENLFLVQDRSLAIAKGAALIANDLGDTWDICPLDVGVITLRQRDPDWGKKEVIPILKEGVRVKDYLKPTWIKQNLSSPRHNREIGIPLQIRSGLVEREVVLDNRLGDVIPRDAKIVNIGMSIDEDGIFHLYVRNAEHPEVVKGVTLSTLSDQIPAGLYNNE